MYTMYAHQHNFQCKTLVSKGTNIRITHSQVDNVKIPKGV